MSPTSVSEALYQALDKPPTQKPLPWDDNHRCSCCLSRTTTTPARKALSDKFSSWHDLAPDLHDGRRWLCRACTWLYRSIDLRRKPLIVTTDPTVSFPTLADIRTRLTTSTTLPPTLAMSLPVGGKKIVAPRARWGMVATDGVVFAWSPRHATWLRTLAALREQGFTETAVTEDTPPFHTLLAMPVDQHERIRHDWDSLRPLRTDRVKMPLFVRLTRGITNA